MKPRGSIHPKFYRGWHRTLRASEDLIHRMLKKQLEPRCWYAKHSLDKMLSFPKDDDNYMGASDGEHEQLIKIYHDDDDALPTADSEQQPEGLGDGCVGN